MEALIIYSKCFYVFPLVFGIFCLFEFINSLGTDKFSIRMPMIGTLFVFLLGLISVWIKIN